VGRGILKRKIAKGGPEKKKVKGKGRVSSELDGHAKNKLRKTDY